MKSIPAVFKRILSFHFMVLKNGCVSVNVAHLVFNFFNCCYTMPFNRLEDHYYITYNLLHNGDYGCYHYAMPTIALDSDCKCYSLCVKSIADDYLQFSIVSPSIVCFICLPFSFCNIYFCLEMLCISWFIFCRKNYVHFFHCQRLWMAFSTLQRQFLELILN